jgi:hypothetical protein
MNNDFERMSKEAVVAYTELLSQHLSIGTEENQDKPYDNLCPNEIRTTSRIGQNYNRLSLLSHWVSIKEINLLLVGF